MWLLPLDTDTDTDYWLLTNQYGIWNYSCMSLTLRMFVLCRLKIATGHWLFFFWAKTGHWLLTIDQRVWHTKLQLYVTMNKSVSYKVAQKSHNHRACWPKWYLVSIMTFNSGFESLHKQLPGKKKKKKESHYSYELWLMGCPITTLQRSQFTTWTSFDFFYITLCGTRKIYVTIYSGRFKGQW